LTPDEESEATSNATPAEAPDAIGAAHEPPAAEAAHDAPVADAPVTDAPVPVDAVADTASPDAPPETDAAADGGSIAPSAAPVPAEGAVDDTPAPTDVPVDVGGAAEGETDSETGTGTTPAPVPDPPEADPPEKRLVSSSKTFVAGSPASVAASAAALESRADVQSDLRKARKKEQRRKHRWRRRIIYAMSIIVFLAVAGAGGIFFYARYRYDEIPKIHSKHLVKQAAAPGQPFNVLLVGDDSRAFVNNPTQVKAFGDEADAGGQRSDVTMVARFVPATKSVTVISIPRDLWVDIPPNTTDIQGMNRINAAFNSGPDLLIQTIESVLHIPINHYISVGFPGFLGMVDALGGVTMDFPTAVKDAYTGLNVTTLGCQVINGTTSLQLVRARHLEYVNSNGHWEYDGLSDFSRIQRQDSFFRAVLAKVNTSITNPLAINGFISSAVGNLAIDDTLSESDLFHIATEFRGLQSSHLVTETLPTTSYVTDAGADVLLAAQPYADQMIAAFNQLGEATPPTTTTTTAPPLANNAVSVDVFNASGGGLLATSTANALRKNGFQITGVNDAPSVIAAGDPSEIFYGPTGLPAAKTLAASLEGKVKYVPDPSLTGNNVNLWVANASLTVTTTTTTTTTPGTGNGTVPGNVYTNTQPEAWNPVPCTLGASAKPASTTTTTTKTSPSTTKAKSG
jgi:LCP family protein required for cell wall assembly